MQNKIENPENYFTPKLDGIKNYLKNKSICLLGNAKSIFNNKKDIDGFDIVCRCNKSFPDLAINEYKEYIGTRTDILFTDAFPIGQKEIKSIIKPKFIVRTRKNLRDMTQWFLDNSIYWGETEWSYLAERGKFSPTTGILGLYFLIENIKFKDLTMYGFDFWITGDHTVDDARIVGHEPEKERIYILRLLKKYPNIKLIEELTKKDKRSAYYKTH